MKILLSGIPSDSHTWNLIYMQLFLEELGHEVNNLGACVPIDLLKESAHLYKPDMIVISSINGHGNIEGVDIAKAIRDDNDLNHIKLVIGGKLGTQGDKHLSDVEKLLRAGFHDVFSGVGAIDDFSRFLQKLTFLLKPCIQAVA